MSKAAMENWQQLVCEHLQANRLKVADPDAIVTELAAHMEESYQNARSQGLDDAAATELTLQEVNDWRVLCLEIRRAQGEDSMNHRTRSLWLPSLITLLGASAALALFQYLGIRPRVLSIGSMAVTLYWAWLATLPAFGALGAYLSRRAAATAMTRLTAGLAPALVMLIVMCLIFLWGLAIDGSDFFRLVSLGLGLATWVAIPGTSLLLGAAPFLRVPRRT